MLLILSKYMLITPFHRAIESINTDLTFGSGKRSKLTKCLSMNMINKDVSRNVVGGGAISEIM